MMVHEGVPPICCTYCTMIRPVSVADPARPTAAALSIMSLDLSTTLPGMSEKDVFTANSARRLVIPITVPSLPEIELGREDIEGRPGPLDNGDLVRHISNIVLHHKNALVRRRDAGGADDP